MIIRNSEQFDFEDFFNELAKNMGKPTYKIVVAPDHPRKTNPKTFKPIGMPRVRRVMFNKPATIAWFEDGSKTVAKSESGDPYDKETGLAICIAKRVLGNAGYRKLMDKHVYNSNTAN